MIAGNLCRCTGYQNIVKSVLRAARDRAGARVTTKLFGTKVPRVEDQRFLRGQGRYVDDLLTDDPRLLHAAVLRSPHAHARITDIDVADVLDVDGVLAVWTYDDLADAMAEPLPLLIPHPTLTHGRTQYALAKDEVNYVGEAIAFVVAVDRYVAEDAVARIRVSYDHLEPVVGIAAARAADRLVHDDVPGNVGARMEQENGDARAAIADAPHTLTLELDVERSACTPMEGRGTVARWDPDTSRLTVWSSTQTSTGVRGCVAAKLGLDLAKVDVITPDVGGGFGVKINHPWPEELLVPLAAMTLGRPVKFTEDRREHFISSAHERAQAAPRRGRLRRRRPGARAQRRVLARPRRLHALRADRPDHHLDPAARPLQAAQLPRRLRVALHQHRHRHALPRRRPAAGLLRDGADDGRDRGLPRQGPHRGAQHQLHPARRVPLRARPGLPGRPPADLRLRRLPGVAGEAQGAGRLGRVRGLPRRDGGAGTAGRHRPRLLRRGHRRRPLRGRPRAHRDLRQGQGRDRPDHPGPGPPDRLRADRRRHPRRALRGRRDHHRRHPQDAVRRGHLRLARGRDERLGDPPRRRCGPGRRRCGSRPRRSRRREDDLEIVDGVVSRARHRRVDRPRHRRRPVQPAALRLRRGVQGRDPVLRRRPRQAAGRRGRRARAWRARTSTRPSARPSPTACTP